MRSYDPSKIHLFSSLFFLCVALLPRPGHSLKGTCQSGDDYWSIVKGSKSEQKKMVKSMCYAVNQENLQKYFLGLENSDVLGEGNFGVVYKYDNPASELFKAGVYKNQRQVAVKKTKEVDYDEVFKELNSSLCLSQYEEFWENETSNLVVIDYCFYDAAVKPRQYYLTLKYFPYTLVDFIDGTAPVQNYNYQMKLVMIVLSIQLEKMHRRNLLHRDIKPANIVLDHKMMAHFIDFGTMSMDLETASSFVGTPTYMSPETTQEQTYGRRADLFSLGLVFNNMINRDTSSHFHMLKQAQASTHFKQETYQEYEVDTKHLVWPQEYKFLSKLMENSVNYSKVLQKIIDKLEKMISEEHFMLERSKSKVRAKMSTSDKIKTVRSLVVPQSMKNNPGIRSAMTRNMDRTDRVSSRKPSQRYVI